jgi:hypothetical protein
MELVLAGIGTTRLGWLKDACNSGSLNSFPIGINYLIGHGKHLFDVAGGGVLLFTSGTKAYCSGMEKRFFSEDTETIGLHRSDSGISVCIERE